MFSCNTSWKFTRISADPRCTKRDAEIGHSTAFDWLRALQGVWLSVASYGGIHCAKREVSNCMYCRWFEFYLYSSQTLCSRHTITCNTLSHACGQDTTTSSCTARFSELNSFRCANSPTNWLPSVGALKIAKHIQKYHEILNKARTIFAIFQLASLWRQCHYDL